MIANIVANLPVLFAAAVAFCVVVYVLADGFDLGDGILFLLAPRNEDRDLMMASVEPVWDGNATPGIRSISHRKTCEDAKRPHDVQAGSRACRPSVFWEDSFPRTDQKN